MKTDTIDRHCHSIRKVLEHVSTNTDEVLTVAQLSRIACIAPFHFHRVFRQVIGEPIGRYMRNLRLDYAIYQLLFTRDAIVEIALQAGYQSHEAFTRAFERTFGVLPSELRAWMFHHDRSVFEKEFPIPSGFRIPSTSFHIHTLPRRSVLFRSHFGSYMQISECWKKFISQLSAAKLSLQEPKAIGILYDDPIRCGTVRYDTCLSVAPPLPVCEGMGIQVLPDIAVVGTKHHGADPPFYTCIRLMNTWMFYGDQRKPRLPSYELYGRVPLLESETAEYEICVQLQ